jgi:hypothetical protein
LLFFFTFFWAFEKLVYFCIAFRKGEVYLFSSSGEMAEWSIAAVLKTVVPKGTGGSNPSLSADHQLKLVLIAK